MISFLMNPEFIISTGLAIIGIILTIFYYYRGRKFRELSYAVEKITILKEPSLIKGLIFRYNGKELEEVSVSDVIIWSSGREVTNRDDLALSGPLTVHFAGKVEILEAQIIHTNEESNDFAITVEEDKVRVDFEYIAKNQGVAIRIIHAPTNEEIGVSCIIKDGKKIFNVGKRTGFFYRIINSKWVKHILSLKVTSFIFVCFTVFLFPHAFIQSSNYAVNNRFNLPENNFFVNLDSLIILVMYIISLILALPHIRNIFKREVPKGLIKDTICER